MPNTDQHDEQAVTLEDQEYQRRVLDAMSAYATLEIEAWREACAAEEG